MLFAKSLFFLFLTVLAAHDVKSSPCLGKTYGLRPDYSKCSQFYNCSAGGKLQECTYPQLYNPDTQQCEHYSMVNCGSRYEPVWECDYRQEFCRYCPPCKVIHPSCKGLPNGLNAWPQRPRTEYFVVCVNDRTVYQGQCLNGRRFDDTLKACVQWY